MAWIILFVAGLLEVGWAVGLKYTDGFTRLWPTVATAIAPVYKEDVRQQAYYPPARQFAVASGTLRTFLGISLRPGFEYAVIDPNRPRGQPNVLFHSRPGAEFVERFEQEVDDSAGFQALVQQALARQGGGAPAAGERQTNAAFARLRIDTNYRAQTSRLTVARLHPQTDWVLVIIENRNDAGYAPLFPYGFGLTYADKDTLGDDLSVAAE